MRISPDRGGIKSFGAGANQIGILKGKAGCLKGFTEMAEEYRIWLDRISTSYGTQPEIVHNNMDVIAEQKNKGEDRKHVVLRLGQMIETNHKDPGLEVILNKLKIVAE